MRTAPVPKSCSAGGFPVDLNVGAGTGIATRGNGLVVVRNHDCSGDYKSSADEGQDLAGLAPMTAGRWGSGLLRTRRRIECRVGTGESYSCAESGQSGSRRGNVSDVEAEAGASAGARNLGETKSPAMTGEQRPSKAPTSITATHCLIICTFSLEEPRSSGRAIQNSHVIEQCGGSRKYFTASFFWDDNEFVKCFGGSAHYQ